MRAHLSAPSRRGVGEPRHPSLPWLPAGNAGKGRRDARGPRFGRLVQRNSADQLFEETAHPAAGESRRFYGPSRLPADLGQRLVGCHGRRQPAGGRSGQWIPAFRALDHSARREMRAWEEPGSAPSARPASDAGCLKCSSCSAQLLNRGLIDGQVPLKAISPGRASSFDRDRGCVW